MSPAFDNAAANLANFNPAGFVQRNNALELENQQRQQSLATAQQEQQLRQQDIQAKQIQNQLAQRQLQDQQIMQRAYANYDPKSPTADEDLEKEMLKGGISYPSFAAFRTQRLDWQKGMMGLDEGRLKVEDTINQRAGDILQSYKAVPDAQKPQMWAQVTAPALSQLIPGQKFDPTNPLVGTALDANIGMVTHHKDMVENALKQQQTVEAGQRGKQAEATAAESAAKLPGAQAESQMKVAEAAAMQNLTPAAIKQQVDGSIDPVKYPDQNARTLNDATNALRNGLGPKGVQAAIKDGGDRIASRENAIAQASITSIPFREANLQNRQFQQTQESYRFHAGEIDKLAQPEIQLGQRIQRLNDTIGQNSPQADALIAPELLSVMSGGQGSGLRMNQAEINQIIGGRSKWESLKTAINKWSLDPKSANSILPEQRQQIHALVDAVTARAQQRQQILMQARSALAGATGPEQHKTIVADAQNKLMQAVGEKPVGELPHVTSKEQHATLPAGAHYIGSDGKEYIKGQ